MNSTPQPDRLFATPPESYDFYFISLVGVVLFMFFCLPILFFCFARKEQISKSKTYFINLKARHNFNYLVKKNLRLLFFFRHTNILFCFFNAIIVLIWSSFGIFYATKGTTLSSEIGDSFGTINTLFSGFAFVGVIVAIILQSRELKSQREELQLTRKELAGQKKELEIQNKTAQQVSFETTFFNMLSAHREILQNIMYNNKKGIEATNDFVGTFYELQTKRKANKGRVPVKEYAFKIDAFQTLDEVESWMKVRLKAVQQEFEKSEMIEVFDSYFRYLYRLIKFVDEDPNLGFDKKSNYIDMLRAQLSSNELLLIFYNGLIEEYSKMKDFIIKYSLLDSLRIHNLILTTDMFFYDKKAYDQAIIKTINDEIANNNEFPAFFLENQKGPNPCSKPYFIKFFNQWSNSE